MAKQFDSIADTHRAFIEDQPMFFTGSAAPGGRVNVSPKGMDCLRVLGANRIIWLNHTGSGNETAGHLLQANRLTLMWCSFTHRPQIMRAYGTATTTHSGEAGWPELAGHFEVEIGARQIFDMTVDLVQTSCGYAVPLMDFVAERQVLRHQAADGGREGVQAQWKKTNVTTIDGAPTGIPVDDQ